MVCSRCWVLGAEPTLGLGPVGLKVGEKGALYTRRLPSTKKFMTMNLSIGRVDAGVGE